MQYRMDLSFKILISLVATHKPHLILKTSESVNDVTYLQRYITMGDKKKMIFVKASDHLLNFRFHAWLRRQPFI